ncbi:MAG: PIG-L family deacetylase [Acidobacteriia bacterium]|nr:PIG-L family deacetylase [Terriglobia bacterium]
MPAETSVREQILSYRSVLLVVAHPDDETIGVGGLLAHIPSPMILVVTDGAPRNLADANAAGFECREDYAAARRLELFRALGLCGIHPDQIIFFNFVDQEPSFDLADLTRRVAGVLRELQPGAILTHPYEGGHPDHDAVAFAVHTACRALAGSPRLFEFTSYHARDGRMEVGRFLPDQDPGEAFPLSDSDRERKQRMVECFATQAHMLRNFPVDAERFRAACAYDFTQPPHSGTLFYENFSWGIKGAQWRALAGEALQTPDAIATQ